MTVSATDSDLLDQWADFVASRLGLHFPAERHIDLERGLRTAMGSPGPAEFKARLRQLADSPPGPALTDSLVAALTVGETYFFREPNTLEALRENVLPQLITRRAQGSRQLRLWSAGCCTGEEAYTLAVLLDRLLPHRDHWRIDILGTDINRQFLQKAREGVYGEWSFRDAPPWLRETYFEPVDARRVRIIPRIRRMVHFAPLNLAQPWHDANIPGPGGVDVILCRNVLMYFTPAQVAATMRSFHRSLVDEGWLAVSATEAAVKFAAPFTPVRVGQTFLYRKNPAHASSATPAWESPAVPESADLRRPPAVKRNRAAVPVATAAVGEPPVAAPADLPPAPAQPDAARRLFDQGDYAGAAAAWDARPPSHADDFGRLAHCQANLGQLHEACRSILRALALDKLDPALHHLHAIVLSDQGEMSAATAAWQRAVFLDADFIAAHHALGHHLVRLGQRVQAARHFRTALHLLDRLEPDALVPHADQLSARRLRALVTVALTSVAA